MVSSSTDISVAIAHHQAGRLDDAETIYRRARGSNPAEADALRLLGVLRFQRGDGDEARKWLQEALRAAPDYAKTHDNLGFVLAGLGHHDQALAALKCAVELEPGNTSFLFNLANQLISMQRSDEALATLDRLLVVDASYIAAHQLMATTLLKKKERGATRCGISMPACATV